MPNPSHGESKTDFMERCVPQVVDEGKPQDQAVAICESKWEGKSMDIRRAHSVFTIKAVDEASRTVSGIATTPTPDRYGDIVEPKGAIFKLPLPLLWQHDAGSPVGHVTKAKVTNDGIMVDAQIAKMDEPGKLKDLLDLAWQSVKAGLVRGFSIGFKSLESSQIDDSWSMRFIKWDWMELSLVTIPANSEASIQVVKSMDDAQMLRRFPGSIPLGVEALRRKPGVVLLK